MKQGKTALLIMVAALVTAALLMPGAAQAGGLKFGKMFKMSQAQEQDIADKMHEELAKDPGLIEEGKEYKQIQRVGKRLVERNKLKEYDYKFFLVDDEEVNAFATPAGYIYVTRGLMKYMAYDESMLAGVMAHELGHAKDRHVAKGYEKMIQGALGLSVLDLILGKKNRDITSVLFAGGQVAFLKYNRDQEEWADRDGVELSYGAGYDAYGMMRGLECLKALYGSPNNDLAEYMSDHPLTDDRIERTREIGYEVCGKEPGYVPIPSPPDKDHPLWDEYGGGKSTVTKTTSPVGSLK